MLSTPSPSIPISPQIIPVEDAYEMIKSMSWTIYSSFRGMYYVMSREDFIQEAITSFLKKNYLQKFNNSITSKSYFVFIGLKNLAIDLLRRSSCRSKYFLEISESGETGSSLYEIIEDYNQFSMLSYILLEETLDILSKEMGRKKLVLDTDLFGTVWLCEYHVFKMVVVGMLKKDIARIFGVTETTIGSYIRKSRDKIREWYLDQN